MSTLKNSLKEILPDSAIDQYRGGLKVYNSGKSLIKNQFRQMKYAGNKVTCPFCEKTFSGFRPTGVLNRVFWRSTEGLKLLESPEINVANAQCPKCGSGERQRLIYFYLLDEMDFFTKIGLELLDVAPDDFLYNKIFSLADIKYLSIDISPARNPMEIMDITRLRFPDNSFDAIICLHVLEHIPEDIKAMAELYRVLKPGGWAILQVPIWAFQTVEVPETRRDQYLELYGHSDHVRRYGFDYKERLEKAKFEVKVDQFSRKLRTDFREEYGLFESEDIYYCAKT